MIHDEMALLRTVLLSSFDQAPLLILADWYEEHDQYEKALLLRAIAANLVLSSSAVVSVRGINVTDYGRGNGSGDGDGSGYGYGHGHGHGHGPGRGFGGGYGSGEY